MYFSNPRALSALTLLSLSSTALVQASNYSTNWNPQGTGCVDTNGFLSCYGSAATTANTCTNECASHNTKGSAPYNTCVNICQVAWYAQNVGCWMQSCWNQVYSCAYQLTAISYIEGSGLAQNKAVVPFYPPPNEASAGACSCNLGQAYGNLSAVTTNTQGTSCTVVASDNATLYDCECCQLTWPISNILTSCPNSDLTVLSFKQFIAGVTKTLHSSPDNCTILDNGPSQCINTYNFPYDNTSMIYNPLTLPSSIPGTAALSNTAGNAMTAFPSSVTVLSLIPSYTSTITPATFAPTASANAVSITGTSILGTTTTPSATPTTSDAGTGTKSAATTTATKSSAATTRELKGGLLGGMVVGLGMLVVM